MTDEMKNIVIENQFSVIEMYKQRIIEKDTQIAKLMNKIKAMQNHIEAGKIMFMED